MLRIRPVDLKPNTLQIVIVFVLRNPGERIYIVPVDQLNAYGLLSDKMGNLVQQNTFLKILVVWLFVVSAVSFRQWSSIQFTYTTECVEKKTL